ncbi:C4-dicarboxylate-binding protein DctP [Desulfocicer vacuolatum DSM 3385]|uniref:C4-dicarboxylate-binding protein DctP n=1 Tax=Desulfocicer vacuolatum DSM 3385 TaxID=1121400 RepID=A0A1W2CQS2_9BACT|nr:DctP family TRAP transporter solute-binding subunit [Desulfocicer vacuolatum]SMC87304.1 C4-dicarboxylate-binding protein DctP [Desulfocicer vacuolatum DSM 3385]
MIFIVILGKSLASNAPIVIRFSHVVAPNTPKGWGAKEFARRVNRELNGKVRVEVFANGTLYRDNEAIEALAAGDLEMAAPSSAKLMGIVPALQLFDMPFLFSDIQSVHNAMDGAIGEEMKEIFLNRNLGIRLLTFWDNAFKQFTCNVHPLLSPDDFKGLKFRIMSSDVLETQMKSLGATGLRLPFQEVYEVLKKGIVDGQENTASNIYTGNFHKVQQYLTFSNHGYLGYLVIINEAFWEKLPGHIQNKLTAILEDVTKNVRKKAQELDRQQSEQIKIYAKTHDRPGISTLNEYQKKNLQKAMLPVYKKFSTIVPERWVSSIKNM